MHLEFRQTMTYLPTVPCNNYISRHQARTFYSCHFDGRAIHFVLGSSCASPSWTQSRTTFLLIEIKMRFIISRIIFYMLILAKAVTPSTPSGRNIEKFYRKSQPRTHLFDSLTQWFRITFHLFPMSHLQALFWNWLLQICHNQLLVLINSAVYLTSAVCLHS